MASVDDKHTEILDVIEKRLIPDEAAKKARGEVFTPLNLVREMLYGLRKSDPTQIWGMRDGTLFEDDPEDRIGGIPLEVWRNPESKWLDPANGIGNFPFVAFLMLDFQLSKTMKDPAARKKHIVEKMLYMIEIDKGNVNTARKIFETLAPGAKSNICCADTLKLKKDDLTREFGVAEFDIVMGNPPFNKGGIRSHTGKQLGDKNETIWPKFVEKSLSWLVPNGILAFITPLSWLKKSHSMHTPLLEKQVMWLKLYDNSGSKDVIKADIPISLYLLKNVKNTDSMKTYVKSIMKRLKLVSSSDSFLDPKYTIPLAFHSIFEKLSLFIEENNLKPSVNTKTVKSKDVKVKLPEVYTLDDKWAIDTYKVKEGIFVKKAEVVHPDANKQKLIIANKASFAGAFIDDGRLSLTGNHKFYILGDNLYVILKLLSFKLFGVVSHFTKYGQDYLDKDAFDYIPDIRKLGIDDITESDFYKLIKLTPDEVKSLDIKKPLDDPELEEDSAKKSVIKSRKRTLTKARRSRQRAR